MGYKEKTYVIFDGDNDKWAYARRKGWIALEYDLPIIAVNLNGLRSQDNNHCPPIVKDKYVVYIPFKMKIIKYALDNFPLDYKRRKPDDVGPRYYNDSVYQTLGLNNE